MLYLQSKYCNPKVQKISICSQQTREPNILGRSQYCISIAMAICVASAIVVEIQTFENNTKLTIRNQNKILLMWKDMEKRALTWPKYLVVQAAFRHLPLHSGTMCAPCSCLYATVGCEGSILAGASNLHRNTVPSCFFLCDAANSVHCSMHISRTMKTLTCEHRI